MWDGPVLGLELNKKFDVCLLWGAAILFQLRAAQDRRSFNSSRQSFPHIQLFRNFIASGE